MRTFFQGVVIWILLLAVWEEVLHHPWWQLFILFAIAFILDLVLTVTFGEKD